MTTGSATTAARPALPGAAWSQQIDDAPVALAVTGSLVAVAGAAGTAWILSLDTGEPLATATVPGGILALDFSRNAAHLALTGPTGHALLRLEDNRLRVFETGAWSSAAHWSGTDRVAIASGHRALILNADGEQQWRTDPAPSTVTDLRWLRQGRRLAIAAYGGIYCHERHTGAPVAEFRYLGSHLAIATDPAERWLCSGNQDASIHIWRTRDAQDLTMTGYPDKISRLAFDPTGRYLASDGAPDITVWDFSGKGPEGTRPRMLRAHETVTALAWRPGNDTILASAGTEGTFALWRTGNGRPGARSRPLLQRELPHPVTALAWSGPNHVILADRRGTIRALPYPSQTLSSDPACERP